MYDPSIVLFIVFTALIVMNLNRPIVALAAFLCIGVVCLTTMHLLPIWANGVAAIVFMMVNAVEHFSKEIKAQLARVIEPDHSCNLSTLRKNQWRLNMRCISNLDQIGALGSRFVGGKQNLQLQFRMQEHSHSSP